jgi:hypothetical protein
MIKAFAEKKAVALFLTLFIILLVVILANIILNIMSSQSRLTHHQVSRIQAYYASMAGINAAIEQLRLGQWTTTPLNTPYKLCKSSGCSIVDDKLPSVVKEVAITISAIDASTGLREIKAKATYAPQ